MKSKILLMTIAVFTIAFSSVAQEKGSFTDSRDGKIYKTVKIGSQIWMAENLAYKVRKGCWAYNDDENNVLIYGYLYDWETAKKICPAGWHLPTDVEWETLTTFLGGDSVAGGNLKSNLNWESPNTSATNSSGFSALPGGSRSYEEVFDYVGNYGNWWSSKNGNVCFMHMSFDDSTVSSSRGNESNGFSVRCIKN